MVLECALCVPNEEECGEQVDKSEVVRLCIDNIFPRIP